MPPARVSTREAVLTLLAVGVTCILARIGTINIVFSGDTPHLIDPDSQYHLRRMLLTISDFPAVPAFDPFLSFPSGDIVPWPPFFDFLGAALAMPFPSPHAILPGLCLFLGLLTTVIVYGATVRRDGPTVALCTALAFSLAGIFRVFQSFGRIDHHALEILLVTSFYIVFARYLERPRAIEVLVMIAIVTCSFLTWPGAIIYYPPALLAAWHLCAQRKLDRRVLRGMFVVFHASAILVALWLRTRDDGMVPSYGYKLLSEFQRDILFFLSALFAATFLWYRGWVRIVVLIPLAALFYALVFHRMFGELMTGMRYVGGMDATMVLTEESSPLFAGGIVPFKDELVRAISFFTPLFLVFPWLAVRYARTAGMRIEILYLTGYFLLLTLFQIRFGYFFMIGFSFIIGSVAARWISEASRPVITVAALCLAAGFCAMDMQTSAERFPPPEVYEMARFLKDRTPRRAEFEQGRTPYGILPPWHLGNYVILPGARPAVAHNAVGVAPRNGERTFVDALLAHDEEELVRILDAARSPYFVVQEPRDDIVINWSAFRKGPNPYIDGNLEPTARALELVTYRLFRFDGMTPPYLDTPGRLRLVFETAPAEGRRQSDRIKIFERVAGARLLSRQGGILKARLATPYRSFIFLSAGTKTGQGTSYRMPYSNDAPTDVRLLSAEIDGRILTVTERDVTEGRTITLP